MKESELRCSRCVFGHQIVAFIPTGMTEDGVPVEVHYNTNGIPIGISRRCFGWFDKFKEVQFGIQRDNYVNPKGDDICIRKNKFKPRTE